MSQSPDKLERITQLTDTQQLRHLCGPFEALDIAVIETGGYSGAKFSKIDLNFSSGKTDRLILKVVDLEDDWFSHRTSDQKGREAQTILSDEFGLVKGILYSPYIAVAIEGNRYGLLMQDLSEGLFPDGKISLSETDQEYMIDKLAEMHAQFWESSELKSKDWLLDMAGCLYQLGPLDHIPFEGGSARNVQDQIKAGWEVANQLLPNHIKTALWSSPESIAAGWQDLPQTLIHGDTKVANFAKAANGALCLLDWAFAGYSPCTFDIGWFVAVNANRITYSKEEIFSIYRGLLEHHLGYRLADDLWNRLEEAGVVCGALMLLWSKALGVENKREGGQAEWGWWNQRLDRWVNRDRV